MKARPLQGAPPIVVVHDWAYQVRKVARCLRCPYEQVAPVQLELGI